MGFRNAVPVDVGGRGDIDASPACLTFNPTANANVPQYYLTFADTPLRRLTLDYIAPGKNNGTVSIRGGCSLVFKTIDTIIGFWGRMSKVAGRKGQTQKLPAGGNASTTVAEALSGSGRRRSGGKTSQAS